MLYLASVFQKCCWSLKAGVTEVQLGETYFRVNNNLLQNPEYDECEEFFGD